MKELERFSFPVPSPCCRGASIGINRTFLDYKIYGCMGCGRTIGRAAAIQEIRRARVNLKQSIAWISSQLLTKGGK